MCHTWRDPSGATSENKEQQLLMSRLSEIFDIEEVETEDTIRSYCTRFHGGNFFLRSQSLIDIQESSDAVSREGDAGLLSTTQQSTTVAPPCRLQGALQLEKSLARLQKSCNLLHRQRHRRCRSQL